MVSRILTALAELLRPTPRTARRADRSAPPRRAGSPGRPGSAGSAATVQVDPRTLGRLRTSYNPSTDGDADPGEIVWTWVPYEEADGRGKDRPVLVVAVEQSGAVIAVPLTSQEHPGRAEYMALGSGDWDGQHRPSYVRLDRIFRVQQSGMRREAAALDARRFGVVRDALRARYGWS